MKIKIFNPDDQEIAVIRTGQGNRIEGIQTPASHPWSAALADEIVPGKSRLHIPPLDEAGYYATLVPQPQPEPITLDQVKFNANQNLNSRRLTRETQGFEYNGKAFQSDPMSGQRIQGALQVAEIMEAAAPGSYAQGWKAADNTLVTLDYTGVKGLFMALAQHVATVFAETETLKQELQSLETVEAVDLFQRDL